jgi:hypothetical protein
VKRKYLMYIWRDQTLSVLSLAQRDGGEVWLREQQKAVGGMQGRGLREMGTLHSITTLIRSHQCLYVTNLFNNTLSNDT